MEYSVEKILRKRNRRGRTEYFVKWEGYDEDEGTWEPVDNLTGCTLLISEFDKNLNASTATTTTTSTAATKPPSPQTNPSTDSEYPTHFKEFLKYIKKDDKSENISDNPFSSPPHLSDQQPNSVHTSHKKRRLSGTERLMTEHQREIFLSKNPQKNMNDSSLDREVSFQSDTSDVTEDLHPYSAQKVLLDEQEKKIKVNVSPNKRIPLTPKRLFVTDDGLSESEGMSMATLDMLLHVPYNQMSNKALCKIQQKLSQIMVEVSKNLSEKQ